MATGYDVIDADGHITEEDWQLRNYMEAPYCNRQATIYPQDNWDRSLGGTLGATAKDAQSWLDAMDAGGVSTAVLYPTGGLGIRWWEPDFAVAVCKAWTISWSKHSRRRARTSKGSRWCRCRMSQKRSRSCAGPSRSSGWWG